jgi:hypothetical protein
MRSINQFSKVEGHESLVRDMSSHAILSTDDHAYEAYKRSRDTIKRQAQELKELKADVTEIKEMLSMLLKGK